MTRVSTAKLSELIRDEIDGATESRGRDSQLTEWIEMAERLEAQVATSKATDERAEKYFDYYACLRLDGDETASFIEDTYNDWDAGEVEWEDHLDAEMERWIARPGRPKPDPKPDQDHGPDYERLDPAMQDWEGKE